MKGLLQMFTRGDRCAPLAAASGKHVEKYGHFKEFLAGNRDALRSLAELEMLYYSGQPFTAADIAFRYEQLFSEVRSLVTVLNQLSEQRYVVLTERANSISAQVRKTLRQAVVRHDLPPVVTLADLPADAIGDAGGKAVNLARVGQETGLMVPAGFVVTAAGYDRFLKFSYSRSEIKFDRKMVFNPLDHLVEVINTAK